MQSTNAASTAQGYSRRILREVKLLDAIVLGILPATIQPFVAHSLSASPDWKTEISAAVVSYGIFFLAYCLYMITKATVKILQENSEEIKNLREFRALNSKSEIFFFPAGLAVSIQRGAQGPTAIVYLHILSTVDAELIFIHLDLTDATGLRVTCERSEPLVIKKLDVSPVMVEQKITNLELEKFQKGMQLNLDGYAKFRDGSQIRREQFRLTTIPNL